MTTATKTPQVILAPTANTAGAGTKGAPVVDSGWVDLGSADGGNLFVSIQNAGALGAAGILQVQASAYAIGTSGTDYQAIASDLNAYSSSTLAGLTTATFWIDPGVRALRVFGYGNTTNNTTFGAVFSGVTRA